MAGEIKIGAAIRPKSGSQRIDALISWLAGRQFGVVARFQLLALGIPAGAIKRRIAADRLHPIQRGVYAVGHRKLSTEGRLFAAVLSGGPEALVCDVSAAAHFGFAKPHDRRIHIAAKTRTRRNGIVFHRLDLLPGETTTKQGIPITTPARTLLDCATTMRPAALEQALREALYLNRTSLPELRRLLRDHSGQRGAKALRNAIEATEDAPGITRSELERWFQRFLRQYRFPPPELNVRIRIGATDIEADCYWRDRKLIVELDTRGTHARRHDFVRDRRRDRAIQGAKIRIVRVADEDRADEPALAIELSRLLGVAVYA